MGKEEFRNPSAENVLIDDGPRIVAPLNWRLHNLWISMRIPFVIVAIVLAWIYIPFLEARSQQNALATEFFVICRRTLKDTDQLPKVPDEALQEAIKKRPVTQSALFNWSPQVSSVIRKGEWVARIEFVKPSNYTIEEKIGPALAEAGYDTPSPGQ
jgi:hypothetical protein